MILNELIQVPYSMCPRAIGKAEFSRLIIGCAWIWIDGSNFKKSTCSDRWTLLRSLAAPSENVLSNTPARAQARSYGLSRHACDHLATTCVQVFKSDVFVRSRRPRLPAQAFPPSDFESNIAIGILSAFTC